MTTSAPLVSVVIPTFNRCTELKQCIDGLLNQTYPNYEVIIVDNNSNDGTNELMSNNYSKFSHIRFVCEKSQGISYAKNRGVKESNGEIVAFIDDDAVPVKIWLESCVQAFIKTGAVGVGGRVLLDRQKTLPQWFDKWAKARAFIGEIDFGNSSKEIMDWLPGGNSAFRKYIFYEIGFFSTLCGRAGGKLMGGEDVEFSQRAIKCGKLYYEPAMLIYHNLSSKRGRLSYVFRSAFWVGVSKIIIKRPPKPSGLSDVVGKDAIISIFSGAGYLYGHLLRLFRRI